MLTAKLSKGSISLWVSLILQGYLAEAQVEHARCPPDSLYGWSYNSKGQDPCQVAEALGRVCDPGLFIQPLPKGRYYSGVVDLYVTPCVCNTVYYTLLSVCALCQGTYADRFDLWSQNCTSLAPPTTYPEAIPSTINVPHYAYLPLDSQNQTVDLKRLLADHGVESTGTGPTSTSTSDTFTPTATTTTFDDGGKKKSKKVGIIVGVVVGVACIVLAAGIIYWVCRRQSKKRWGTPSQMHQNTGPGLMGPDGSNMGVYASVPPASPMTPNEKVYNPSDPSTFPQTQTLSYQPPIPVQPYTPDRNSMMSSAPASPTQYSTSDYQASFQQQQQAYPVAVTTPGGNSAVTPPGAAPQMMNPYEAHYQPQPQRGVGMSISYGSAGNSSPRTQ